MGFGGSGSKGLKRKVNARFAGEGCGGGYDYKVSVTGLALCHYGFPVISSVGTSRYGSHSFMKPVKWSREISR